MRLIKWHAASHPYRKSKESLGFKVTPKISQSFTKTNFDERKLEEKGGIKRFVNLGTHRNTKQKVYTRSIGNNQTKKDRLKIRKRVPKDTRNSGRSVRN